MITLPALAGVILAGPAPQHLPLLLFWFSGYFLFHAASLWLKSRRKPRYWPPVRVYLILTAALGVATLAARPALAVWAVPFAPLVAVAAWAASTRRERSLANDTATVLAASLMTAVTFSAAAATTDPRWVWVWTVTALQFAYFFGTVLHVKALIRERRNPRWARTSLAYHVTTTALLAALAATGALSAAWFGGWAVVVVWVGLSVRAWWMPRRQVRRGPYRPMQIGLTEVAFSLLQAAAQLL